MVLHSSKERTLQQHGTKLPPTCRGDGGGRGRGHRRLGAGALPGAPQVLGALTVQDMSLKDAQHVQATVEVTARCVIQQEQRRQQREQPVYPEGRTYSECAIGLPPPSPPPTHSPKHAPVHRRGAVLAGKLPCTRLLHALVACCTHFAGQVLCGGGTRGRTGSRCHQSTCVCGGGGQTIKPVTKRGTWMWVCDGGVGWVGGRVDGWVGWMGGRVGGWDGFRDGRRNGFKSWFH